MSGRARRRAAATLATCRHYRAVSPHQTEHVSSLPSWNSAFSSACCWRIMVAGGRRARGERGRAIQRREGQLQRIGNLLRSRATLESRCGHVATFGVLVLLLLLLLLLRVGANAAGGGGWRRRRKKEARRRSLTGRRRRRVAACGSFAAPPARPPPLATPKSDARALRLRTTGPSHRETAPKYAHTPPTHTNRVDNPHSPRCSCCPSGERRARPRGSRRRSSSRHLPCCCARRPGGTRSSAHARS